MKNNGKSDALQEAKYDVFISYSRKDYVDERTRQPIKDSPVARLIDFLDSHAVSYWIDREGIYVGDKFPGKIAEAISESKMLIFVSSVNSNHSKWTAREISLADDRGMHIFPIRIDSSEYGRDIKLYFQGVQYIDYSPSGYIGQLESILLTAINKEKENYEMKLQEEKKRITREEEEKRKDLFRRELTSDKNKYYLHSSNLKKESDSIISKLLSVGEDRKTCPVCGENVPLQSQYCGTCGWTFMPSFEISENKIDKEQLALIKGLWDEVLSSRNATVLNPEQVSRMKKEIEGYIAKISELEEKLAHSSLISAVNPHHDFVDLGLPSGTLWATCNVGASKPSDYGDYLAWGETSPKKSYDFSNLKYCNDSIGNSFSKYNVHLTGTKDGKTVLEPSDDAAHAQWGGVWRMPTREEWKELYDNCDWKWTKQDGCNGYKVASKKNGASIFLPAAGWRDGESWPGEGEDGNYWASSLCSGEPYGAFRCRFTSGGVGPSYWRYRCLGLSVRPVASFLQ